MKYEYFYLHILYIIHHKDKWRTVIIYRAFKFSNVYIYIFIKIFLFLVTFILLKEDRTNLNNSNSKDDKVL